MLTKIYIARSSFVSKQRRNITVVQQSCMKSYSLATHLSLNKILANCRPAINLSDKEINFIGQRDFFCQSRLISIVDIPICIEGIPNFLYCYMGKFIKRLAVAERLPPPTHL